MKLNQIINFAIVGLMLIAFSVIYFNERATRKLAESNFSAAVKHHDVQIELTKRQAEQLYGKQIDSLAEQLSIKPKQITQYIKGDIQYRDTGSVKIIARPGDTVLVYPDSITGMISKPCYDLSLLLYKGKFYEQLDYHDVISSVIYRERPHKIWFIKYGRWRYRGAIYSNCRDTTYVPFEVVKVGR
jgi:hypothetical protein